MFNLKTLFCKLGKKRLFGVSAAISWVFKVWGKDTMFVNLTADFCINFNVLFYSSFWVKNLKIFVQIGLKPGVWSFHSFRNQVLGFKVWWVEATVFVIFMMMMMMIMIMKKRLMMMMMMMIMMMIMMKKMMIFTVSAAMSWISRCGGLRPQYVCEAVRGLFDCAIKFSQGRRLHIFKYSMRI